MFGVHTFWLSTPMTSNKAVNSLHSIYDIYQVAFVHSIENKKKKSVEKKKWKFILILTSQFSYNTIDFFMVEHT